MTRCKRESVCDKAVELEAIQDEMADGRVAQGANTQLQETVIGDMTTSRYPKGSKLAIIVGSLAASVFLVALDETIIATAIPRITDEFDSLADVGWYGSAYFLTLCSFQLTYGKLFTLFQEKSVFLVALAIFEIGSVVCATAQNSAVLILGRAVAGLGSGGINAGYIIILAASIPLERRPVFVASYSLMYGIATVSAPVLGGAFTTHLSWRWCFWINLPFGGLTLCFIWFLYRSPSTPSESRLSLAERCRQLDLLGTGVMIAGISCLLLVLQWAGTEYAWRSWRIIVLIFFFVILMVVYAVLQIVQKEHATIPLRIITRRSVVCSAWFVFTAGAAMNVMEYFLPIYFQAIDGVTALQSGIRILPIVLGMVIFSLVAGVGVSRWGYYTPFMLGGAAVLSVGTGLITTLNVSTGRAAWISFQVLVGMGGGLGIQQAHTAAQTVLADADVPTGAVILIFAQILGGSLFISVAENVFQNRLVAELRHLAPAVDLDAITNAGLTGIRDVVPAEKLAGVLEAYSKALQAAYYVSTGLAILSVLGALGTEWKSVKDKKEHGEVDI